VWIEEDVTLLAQKKSEISSILVIYDQFLIRIVIIVVKVHNQLNISRLNPVNKKNPTILKKFHFFSEPKG
jgi:hypothetical protein